MSDLFDLPNGWEWVKLKDVCDLLNGYAFKAKEYVEQSDTVIIRMGNIRPNGGFDAEHKIKYLPNKYKDELPNYILNDGDLVIAMTDLASEMRILGNPTLVSNTNGRTFMLNQRVGKLHKFDFSKIVVEYLRYILSASQIKNYYKSLGGGGLQINIGKQQILSVDFPLPPLSEQQRIVSKLDKLFEKIDKAIALHQKNMDEADVFMGSVLNDVFGELEEKYGLNILSDSVANPKKDIVDGPFGSNLKATEYIDSGIPIIRLQNIQRFQFIEKDIKFVSEEKAQQLQRHTFISGDIVITKLGDPLGKSCIVPDFLENGIIVADVIRVRVDETKSNSRYINYSINSPTSINQFSENSTGATRQRVKLTMVRDLKIPLPSLQIQQKVVSYLDEISQKIEKIKQIQKEKMESLKALKASILDQAFRGEL